MSNEATFLFSTTAQAARNAQYGGTPFTDDAGNGDYNTYLGCNRGGSNAPGIGISTGSVLVPDGGVPRPDNWTELDQAEAARIPQDSSHIGGINAAQAVTDLTNVTPQFTPAVIPVTAFVDGASPDVNDTLNLVVADTAAADGAEMDSVSGAINDTGATVAIGDLIWGRVPVT